MNTPIELSSRETFIYPTQGDLIIVPDMVTMIVHSSYINHDEKRKFFLYPLLALKGTKRFFNGLDADNIVKAFHREWTRNQFTREMERYWGIHVVKSKHITINYQLKLKKD